MRVVNTLLAANLLGGNCIGSLTDLGHNMSSDGTCNFTNTGSMNNTDPKVGPLADNGGPAPTIALLPGSPAIDAGDTAAAPLTDQRGFPRPAGSAADIGAFEYGSMLPVLSIARSGASLFDILAQGNSNQWCRLLASSNLSSWVPIATNQIGADGTVHFSCDGSARRGFYRVVMLALPAMVQAQFNFRTNNGTITITGYYGSWRCRDDPQCDQWPAGHHHRG
jgi:hypothetical protein